MSIKKLQFHPAYGLPQSERIKALKTLRILGSITQAAHRHNIHPQTLRQWKKRLEK